MAQSPVAVQVPGMQVSFRRWKPKAPHILLYIPLFLKPGVLRSDWLEVNRKGQSQLFVALIDRSQSDLGRLDVSSQSNSGGGV